MTTCPQLSANSRRTVCAEVLCATAPRRTFLKPILPSTLHAHLAPRDRDRLSYPQARPCSLLTSSTGPITPAIFLIKELKSNKQNLTRVHTTEELL
jgi:hypothetical protein